MQSVLVRGIFVHFAAKGSVSVFKLAEITLLR